MKDEKFAYNLNDVSQGETKPTGVPLAVKILMIVAVLAIGGYFAYTKMYVKLDPPRPVAEVLPAEKALFYKGQIVVAKCKDFADIGLYLESDITMTEYSTTLEAISTIPSATLVIPNQELTYKAKSGKLLVYKCQVEKGVLMGKLKKL